MGDNNYNDPTIDATIRAKVDNYLKNPGATPLINDQTPKPEIEKIQVEMVKMIKELQTTNKSLGAEYNKRGIFDGQRKKLEKNMEANDNKVDKLRTVYSTLEEKKHLNQFTQEAAHIMQQKPTRKP